MFNNPETEPACGVMAKGSLCKCSRQQRHRSPGPHQMQVEALLGTQLNSQHLGQQPSLGLEAASGPQEQGAGSPG